MTPERLHEIRERANLQCGLDGDDADDLLAHVDHLTAELATAHTAWDEWKASSRAGHAHASDMAAENARLRECVTEAVDYCNDMAHDYEAGYVARAVLDLLNPTEGEDHE